MTPRNPYTFTREEYNELVKKLPTRIMSQRSDYEEIELVEDCTLYDIYRQPRVPVTDPSVTRTLPVRVLNADLTCPICLGIIRNTEVVMECLHRFCGECIQRSLRVGKNECPSCRMHIPSKRSLRKDPNFDELIAKIYPDLDAFTIQEEKLIAEINRERHFNNALTQSTKMGVQNQQTMRRNGGKKRSSPDEENASPSSSPATSNGTSRDNNASWASASTAASLNGHASTTEEANARKKARATTNGTTAASSDASTTPAAPAKEESDDKVNVRVLLHPDETGPVPKLDRTLFRTSYKLKIRHLKKHLTGLLKLPNYNGLRIVLSSMNCDVSGLKAAAASGTGNDVVRKDLLFDQELEDYVSLYDVYQQYGMGTKWELLLYYHFSDTIVNGVAQFIASGV